jgi:hypothetical protein
VVVLIVVPKKVKATALLRMKCAAAAIFEYEAMRFGEFDERYILGLFYLFLRSKR